MRGAELNLGRRNEAEAWDACKAASSRSSSSTSVGLWRGKPFSLAICLVLARVGRRRPRRVAEGGSIVTRRKLHTSTPTQLHEDGAAQAGAAQPDLNQLAVLSGAAPGRDERPAALLPEIPQFPARR